MKTNEKVTNINWYRYLPPPLDPFSHSHTQWPVNLSHVLFIQFVLQEYWQFSPYDCTQTVNTKKKNTGKCWKRITLHIFLKFVSNL